MTYTLPRYASYQEYLNAEELSPDGNYRLLSTGEVIEVPTENEPNRMISCALVAALLKIQGIGFLKFICVGNKELQVKPATDECVNRKPDLMVLRPEHIADVTNQSILLEMPAPAFVAEVVSPGSEASENYKRDYVWKRQQYEWLEIPEYWIIDPHREKVVVLNLVEGRYQEIVFRERQLIKSVTYPALQLTAEALLTGEIDED